MTQCELKRGEARSHCTWTRGLSAGGLAHGGAEEGAGLRHQRLPSRDGAAARRGHQPLRALPEPNPSLLMTSGLGWWRVASAVTPEAKQ